MTLEPILVFCVLTVEPQRKELSTFNRPVNKFPPNSSVTLEGGKLIIRVQPSDELLLSRKNGKQSHTPIKDNVKYLADT